jgi:hypothetical protein
MHMYLIQTNIVTINYPIFLLETKQLNKDNHYLHLVSLHIWCWTNSFKKREWQAHLTTFVTEDMFSASWFLLAVCVLVYSTLHQFQCLSCNADGKTSWRTWCPGAVGAAAMVAAVGKHLHPHLQAGEAVGEAGGAGAGTRTVMAWRSFRRLATPCTVAASPVATLPTSPMPARTGGDSTDCMAQFDVHRFTIASLC